MRWNRVATALQRARRRRHPDRDDGGFTLIEMVIAIGLLAVILPAFAELFVGSSYAASYARLKEVAATVADTALDQARSVSPPSELLTDGPSAGSAPLGVTFTGYTLNPVVLAPQTATIDNRVYTANLYAGTCYLQPSGQCTTTSASSRMIRVIADVTWSAPRCPTGGCYYVSSTLISNLTDSVLNINPNAAPATPTNLSATAGNGRVVLSWSAAGSQYPITGYTVSYTGGGGGYCIPSPSTATTCTVTGLTNGTAYSFTVTATSAGGTSSPSATVVATPTDPPAAPTNVTAAPGNDQLVVSWAAPASDYPITTYTVTATGGNGGSCTTSATPPATPPTTCTLSGLSNGTFYTITVTATSSGGTSPASSSVAASPTDPPSAPSLTSVTAGTSRVVVSWNPPTQSDYPVTGYTVTATGGSGSSCIPSPPTSTSCTVTGLANGTSYSFAVTATSSGGVSPPSNSMTSTPIAAPNGLSATPSSGQVALSWSEAPTATVTGYTVTATAGGQSTQTCTTGSPSATTCTVTGLTNGVAYSFSVVANSAGGQSSAATLTATPGAVPTAPVIGTVTVSGGGSYWTVSVPWAASTGATSYTVTAYQSYNNAVAGTWTTTSTALNITSFNSRLSTYGSYYFTVTASNAAGTSASSASSNTVRP